MKFIWTRPYTPETTETTNGGIETMYSISTNRAYEHDLRFVSIPRRAVKRKPLMLGTKVQMYFKTFFAVVARAPHQFFFSSDPGSFWLLY